MGQKANPKSLRLIINKDWDSQWIAKNLFAYMLLSDCIIRRAIAEKLINAGINRVVIERGAQEIKIIIHSSRPGVIIGRSGKGINDLKKYIENSINSSTDFKLINSQIDEKVLADIKKKISSNIKINITEIREPETYAAINASDIAIQLEKRMPYRKVIKRTLSKITNNRKVKGVKVCVSGRLGGVDIARTEKLSVGSIPLASFKLDVDYAYTPAKTANGIIGVKVWIYKKSDHKINNK